VLLLKTRSLLRFCAEDAKKIIQKRSYEDNSKFHPAFLATALSYATRFWETGKCKNFKYRRKLEILFKNVGCTVFNE
jgi:hypothetical protein